MKDYLELIQTITELKTIKRQGWVKKEIPNPESVADHSFGVTILAFLLAEKAGLNKTKCLEIAITHEITEVVAGDITPHDNISLEKQHEIELKALKQILETTKQKEIMDLWEEFEELQTPEAKFVKELDKIEMLIQAHKYKQKHPEANLKEFWIHVDKWITTPILREIFDMLPYEE